MKLTNKQIMTSSFKCDDGIWRGVWKFDEKNYIMIIPNQQTGKNGFVNVPASWFEGRMREEK
jgi:hypothetical protein